MKSFDSLWTESHDCITPPQRDEKSESAAQGGNHQAFKKKLRNDLTAGCTDCGANCKLAGARGTSGCEQVCKIRAGNEQNQGNGAEKKGEILSILPDQIFQEGSYDDGLTGIGLRILFLQAGRDRIH